MLQSRISFNRMVAIYVQVHNIANQSDLVLCRLHDIRDYAVHACHTNQQLTADTRQRLQWLFASGIIVLQA